MLLCRLTIILSVGDIVAVMSSIIRLDVSTNQYQLPAHVLCMLISIVRALDAFA